MLMIIKTKQHQFERSDIAKSAYHMCELSKELYCTGAFKSALKQRWIKTANSEQKNAIRAANTELKRIRALFKIGFLNVIDVDNDTVVNDYADAKSIAVYRIASSLQRKKADDSSYIAALSKLCAQHEIDAVAFFKKHGASGAVARLSDSQFWRLRLRRLCNLRIEHIAKKLNFIAKQRDIYCSSVGMSNHRVRRSQNIDLLQKMWAENQWGQEFCLSELVDKSVSNPAVQRAELMSRLKGFEILAKEQKKVGVFFTVTCPSKYHSALSSSGAKNPKYQGFSARQGQDYLNRVWSRVRAKYARNGIECFGFRVAEPHHDSTPHSHFWLFFDKQQARQAIEIFESYATAEDAHELITDAARKARFYAKWLQNNDKHSPLSYIAKYISKNIDGFGLDVDLYDKDAASSAEKIKAWASLNCIRQFQQIGGASVTAWRELRRLNNADDEALAAMPSLLKNALRLIESSLKVEGGAGQAWADYCKFADANGLKLHRIVDATYKIVEDVIARTGEIISKKVPVLPKNKYGEVVKKIAGIWLESIDYVQRTRFMNWRIFMRKSSGCETWTCVNNCTPLINPPPPATPQKIYLSNGGFIYAQ